jgi:hypothetical protein
MNITMMLEGVSVDVEYEVTKCDNSNGVGGDTTYEVDIKDVEVHGVNIMPFLSEDMLMRIDEHIIEVSQALSWDEK